MITESWISPKTVKGLPSKLSGRGFFAKADIARGEIVAIKAGHIINHATLLANQHIIRDSELQIADDSYLAPLNDEEFEHSMIFYNHSCKPNAGYGGNVILVAICDIKSGEEITADYCLHSSHPDYRMACNCRTESCRKIITGNDWQLPDLQKKYAGYFQWYIQRKIDAL